MRSVGYRWSAQDNVTIHGVPYVGRVLPHSGTLLMATGFAKWGLTGGTAAAMILSDRILGRDNAWAEAVRSAPDRAARGRAGSGGGREDRPAFRRRPPDGAARALRSSLRGEGDIVRHRGEGGGSPP